MATCGDAALAGANARCPGEEHPPPCNGVGEGAPSDGSRASGNADQGGGHGYRYSGETFPTERDMLVRFLDDYRAAEAFGAVILTEWAGVAQEPVIRGGLRTISAREHRHSEMLADRLHEIGGACRAEVSDDLKEAARARLAARGPSDLEKLEGLLARYADIETAVQPIRAVMAQIDEDLETKAILGTILDEEIATLRWLSTTRGTLRAREGGPTQRTPSRD